MHTYPSNSHSSSSILATLARLKRSRTRISVRISGCNLCYSCAVTALSPEHRVFVLEEFRPELSPEFLRRGQKVTLIAEDAGDEFVFESQFIEPLVPHQDYGYQFSVPHVPTRGVFRPQQFPIPNFH